jgi:hypothetical protein
MRNVLKNLIDKLSVAGLRLVNIGEYLVAQLHLFILLIYIQKTGSDLQGTCHATGKLNFLKQFLLTEIGNREGDKN